jgi:ankyrin repeat protein
MSMLSVLIKSAPNAHETVNWQGDTPLHLLLTSPAFRADPQNFQAEAYSEEMVKSTLKDRIHLASTLNNSGATLLHVACAHGAHERVLMILLELAPESAEFVDNEGMLPLHYVAACISGKCTPAIFAEKLVEANQEAVIHQCNTGDTPLHLFVSNAKKNIDKHERNSRNTAKVVEALLGSADYESMCPLLVKNRDSVST